MTKKLGKRFNCATEFALAVLEGKWKGAILCCLEEQPCRYAQLRKRLPGVSDKMLSARLRDLVEAGFVERKRLTERGGIQMYALSPLGCTLGELLKDLSFWARQHAATFGVEIEDFMTTSQAETTASTMESQRSTHPPVLQRSVLRRYAPTPG